MMFGVHVFQLLLSLETSNTLDVRYSWAPSTLLRLTLDLHHTGAAAARAFGQAHGL